MAKKFTITASVNQGDPVQKDVLVKDTEVDLNIGFYYRVYQAYELGNTDTIAITSISGPTDANDPLGGFLVVPPVLLAALALGQISLAFID